MRAALLLSKEYYVKITLKKAWAICAGLAALALSSCDSSDKTETLPPTIEVKTTVVDVAGYSQYAYVRASSSWKITFLSDDGEAVNWILADPSSGNGNTDVMLTVASNDFEDERSATIIVTSKGGEASAKLTQKGKSGGNRGGNLSPETDWLELPAIPDGTDAFTHSMTVGSVKTRNYSFIWDYDNLVAPWVAYPLCNWNIGSAVKRTDYWAFDPLVAEDEQPALVRIEIENGKEKRYSESFRQGNLSLKDGNYLARGHQIPSADRLSSFSSNAMTFYGTNMTPQIQNGFNGDIWKNLEDKVRSWARSSDTLYVVTGCVIDYPNESEKLYACDYLGKKVTVPTAYYKVVLRYQKNSTIGYSGYSACAVWMDHKAYSTKTVDSRYSMSVDDLEKRLGIDFFVNLPAKIGEAAAAKVEAEDPAKVSWWW